jgi:hypothetical protein
LLVATFETRPVFHQRDGTIRGHAFCSFLALVLRKELYRRLNRAEHALKWSDIKQDLSALHEIVIYRRTVDSLPLKPCLTARVPKAPAPISNSDSSGTGNNTLRFMLSS